jgi:hypothetical protein
MTVFRAMPAAAALLFGLSAGVAWAAPQPLGLVATAEPEPMQCHGGECSAILGAFCLQEDRKPPAYGTAYAPVDDGGVTLVVATSTGETVRLPAEGLLRFASYRGYTAVRATLRRQRLAALEPRSIAVAVGPRVTLAAPPEPGDPEPLRPEDLALARGPLRAAGEALFERPGERADAARLIASAINLLPDDDGPSTQPEIWRRLAARRAGLAAAGGARAHRAIRACQRQVAASTGFGLRSCLEMRHKTLMREINRTFWETLRGGV